MTNAEPVHIGLGDAAAGHRLPAPSKSRVPCQTKGGLVSEESTSPGTPDSESKALFADLGADWNLHGTLVGLGGSDSGASVDVNEHCLAVRAEASPRELD